MSIVEPSADLLLRYATTHTTIVWLAGPNGDRELTRQLGMRLVREPGLAELELMYGSWDPPGARLLDAVTVMDRLVSPGGDPWLASHAAAGDTGAQGPHERLAHYLLEEAYEAYDAIRSGDVTALREELGDVLLQIILHARIGATGGEGSGFTIDDVAGDLVGKLIRRNPHVFGDARVEDLGEITRNWERIKRDEKSRTSSMDGIPLAQPALALAAKVLARAESADPALARPAPVLAADKRASLEAELGDRLFSLVEQARAAGVDAEAALRRVVLDLMDEIRREESGAPVAV